MKSSEEKLFNSLVELFSPYFSEIDQAGAFKDAYTGNHPKIMLVSPGAVRERKDQLVSVLERHGIADHDELKYPWNHVRDRLDRCAVLFGHGACEITPPFLPALAMDVLERPNARRVYLSATLRYKTDFIRAFGREPVVCIEPKNDAGNGERLILFGRQVTGGIEVSLVEQIAREKKIVVAVPSGAAAENWKSLGVPPEAKEFSQKLNAFRGATSGAFVLVSRVDGIDLPHDTCRLMVLDGLPAGGTLLEKFQWEYLNMMNLFAARIANRLAQLFGRINRGRNDYGAFLIAGNDLNVWLSNDRNLALLPDLLQQQIKLGKYVQERMRIDTGIKVRELIDKVLGRDKGWLKFYGENISLGSIAREMQDKANNIEEVLSSSALAEAQYAVRAWDGEYADARNALEETVENTSRVDPLLAGWQGIWLGACYEQEGDKQSAYAAYRSARKRLGTNMVLPTGKAVGTEGGGDPLNSFGLALDKVVSFTSQDAYNRELKKLERRVRPLDGSSPAQMEEAVRALGEALGWQSTRPDNDRDTGPDVLWEDTENAVCLAFELKTNKDIPARYTKKSDISQVHDHLAWIASEKSDLENLGLIFVGPHGHCDRQANPSEEMWLADPVKLVEIRDELIAIVKDIRRSLPLERPAKIRQVSVQKKWSLGGLADRLRVVRMIDIHDRGTSTDGEVEQN